MKRATPAQSAMEYLMTYGWAILIIAVVLGALYSLGVFNTASLQPKVPGGGCHVFRPNGPGTSWNVNLVGSCNNALPQYVAQFNGQSSYIHSGSDSLVPSTDGTISFWLNEAGPGSGQSGMVIIGSTTPLIYGQSSGTSITSYWGSPTSYYGGVSISLNQWVSITAVWKGMGTSNGIVTFYKNGKITYTSPSVTLPNAGGHGMNIGEYNSANFFSGSIANVQIYNTSLTANQVQYLYNEGIGGVPISPQYLVGWWPLNGDVLDYSGNNNNGIPTNIIYNGSWTSGYYH